MDEEATERTRELVALFVDRPSFDRAVARLLEAGFRRDDLSVLAGHQSLAAAGKPPRPADEALTALLGEFQYAFPLTTAGLIAIVGGPITAAVAATVAAGVGGMAIKGYLDELTGHPHTEEFARALESGGVILWVRLPDDPAELPERQAEATRILTESGGRDPHPVERPR